MEGQGSETPLLWLLGGSGKAGKEHGSSVLLGLTLSAPECPCSIRWCRLLFQLLSQH